jgi:hypothetical protein
MEKIITLFQRNYETDRLVRNEVVPEAAWVQAGEGKATIKHDGTCCLVKDGTLYKRYELKHGKSAPPAFEAAQAPDAITGDTPGWVPVGEGPEDRWHREAFVANTDYLPDGTYELCGPKVQGNPEHWTTHVLVRHGRDVLSGVPRDFEGLKAYLATHDIEGIVWHHPDGRVVKLKGRDFRLRRGGGGRKEAER